MKHLFTLYIILVNNFAKGEQNLEEAMRVESIEKNIRENTIFKGKIRGVESKAIGNDIIDFAVVEFCHGEAFISSKEMEFFSYNDRIQKRPGVDPRHWKMREFVNNTVEFTIIEYDEKSGQIFGSRQQALKKLRNHNINIYNVGDIVKVRVINVFETCAIVEGLGFQNVIYLKEIAWGRIYAIEDYVKMGQEMDAKIINIDKDKHTMAFSIRQASKEPYEQYIIDTETFIRDGQYEGIIREVINKGIFVELVKGVTVMCNFSYWMEETPKVGDKVVVKIKRFKDDRRYIDGTILKSPYIKTKYIASETIAN